MAVQRGVWLTRLMNAVIAELWMIELKLIWVSASTRFHSVRLNWIISPCHALKRVLSLLHIQNYSPQFVHIRVHAWIFIFHSKLFLGNAHAVDWKIISINCIKWCALATTSRIYRGFNEIEVISFWASKQKPKKKTQNWKSQAFSMQPNKFSNLHFPTITGQRIESPVPSGEREVWRVYVLQFVQNANFLTDDSRNFVRHCC